MNDITALALLVSKAKASAFTMKYISQFEASDIEAYVAREMWSEAENAGDVKANCCDFLAGGRLLELFGDDPWYAGWPMVPNHEYQYLERILNAVRTGLNEMENTA